MVKVMQHIKKNIALMVFLLWHLPLYAQYAEILKRGYLICGVSDGLAGFSSVDNQGRWQGIDVDFCRAVAAATLGHADKVKFVPLSAKQRFTALQAGQIDILSRNTTWTFMRDTTLGLNFAGILYYDGQGFMVRQSSKIKTKEDLQGAMICTNTGTTTELNIADFFQRNHLKYQMISFEKTQETFAAYLSGRCDAYSTDASGLAAQLQGVPNPSEHRILPFFISKEPLGPMVRQGDEQWNQIVRWVLFGLINAEEEGVNQQNVLKMRESTTEPSIQRLLGKQGNFGAKLGLSNDWLFNVIQQVGNYQDIYERNVGQNSPLKIPRGLNALWNHGGLHYAPPFR